MSYGTDAPFGLQPRVSLTGGAWNNQQNVYQIPSGYAQNIFTGDPVFLGADGFIHVAPDANASALYLGVFVGCEFSITVPNAAGNYVYSPFWPANQATLNGAIATAFVIEDPTVEFSIQCGHGGNMTTFTQANVGQNYAIVIGAGSTLTGQSGAWLDLTTTSNTQAFKVIRLEPSINPLQVQGNAYVNVVGVFNADTYKSAGTVNPT